MHSAIQAVVSIQGAHTSNDNENSLRDSCWLAFLNGILWKPKIMFNLVCLAELLPFSAIKR